MARYPLISFVIELSTLELTPLEELCQTLHQQTYPHFECLITLTPRLIARLDAQINEKKNNTKEAALAAFLSAENLSLFIKDPRFIFPALPNQKNQPVNESRELVLSSQTHYKAPSPLFPFLADILGRYFTYLPLSVRLPSSFLATVVSELTPYNPHLFTSPFFSQEGHHYPKVSPSHLPQPHPTHYLPHYLNHLPQNIPHPPLIFIKSRSFLARWHKKAQKFTTQCRPLTHPTSLLSSSQLFQLYLLHYSQSEEITFHYHETPLYRILKDPSPPHLSLLMQEFLKIITVNRQLTQASKARFSPLVQRYLEDLGTTLVNQSWQRGYLMEPSIPEDRKTPEKELPEKELTQGLDERLTKAITKKLTKELTRTYLPQRSIRLKWWLLKREATFFIRLIKIFFPKL